MAGCIPSDGGAGLDEPAPPLAGPTLAGSTFDIAEYLGRPVVVNFWASWCVPCRQEFPVLRDASAAHAADGMILIGVLFNDDPAPAREFVEAFGADWDTVLDQADVHATAWRVAAPPQTYFVDAEGIVRGIHIGEMTAADFERQYAKIAP